jgi:deoxyribodipyrimidine photo-lyase
MIKPKDINRNNLTSKSTELSPELAKGKVRPEDVIRQVNKLKSSPDLTEGEQKYLSEIKRQLVFREFANSAIRQQTYRQPEGAKGMDSEEFIKLDKGETGIPIIDAAVREMKSTGTPHNRARLLLARHAIRTLNIDPEVISLWFKKHFTDYDPTLTTFNVVQAASGANFGEPYFRTSNALTATKRLDPDSSYRSQWLPSDYTPKKADEVLEEIKQGNQK